MDDLLSDGVLKAARSHMNEHIIYINQKKIDDINHLIVHECYHIFRFWSVSEPERKIFAVSNSFSDELEHKWRKELGNKANSYPQAIFEMWKKGSLTLFYNTVTDSRIENGMFSEYEGLRNEQRKSLKRLESEVKLSMDKKIQKMVPPSLFVTTSAMNYAFFSLLTPIVGKGWKKGFKGHAEIINLGNKLLRLVPDEDGGLLQDIEILNNWSEILGFKGIRWAEFEDVPLGYEYQY